MPSGSYDQTYSGNPKLQNGTVIFRQVGNHADHDEGLTEAGEADSDDYW